MSRLASFAVGLVGVPAVILVQDNLAFVPALLGSVGIACGMGVLLSRTEPPQRWHAAGSWAGFAGGVVGAGVVIALS